MRKLLPAVLFLLALSFSALLSPPASSAAWIPIGNPPSICFPFPFSSVGDPTQDACLAKISDCPLNGDKDILITPCLVNESTPLISLKINNIPAPKTEPKQSFNYYCLKTAIKDCGEDDWNKVGDGKQATYSFPQLCGAGASALKTNCQTDGSDWFHVGQTYRVIIAQGTNEKNVVASHGGTVVKVASFYIRHFYPQVLSPINSNATEGKTLDSYNITSVRASGGLDITVSLHGRDNKEGTNDSNIYNDYWITVFAQDTEYVIPHPTQDNPTPNTPCLYIQPGGGGNVTVHLPATYADQYGNNIDLTPGSYVLRIKDGKGGNHTDNGNATCYEGDFTYYDIPFSIGGTDNEGQSNEKRYPGEMAAPIADPFGKEGNVKGLQPPAPPSPCEQSDSFGNCKAVKTALGITIHTDPRIFVQDIFSLVLSIGGIAAFIFFIQAGYTMMTSAGNKEKVGQAREQITAAISGLIFIILSLAILQFIGFNILHLPGFK